MKLFAKISLAILLLVGAVLLLGFVRSEQEEVKIWKFEIKIEGNQDVYFINSNIIQDQIREAGIVVDGMNSDKLDLNKIQSIINKNPSVKSSLVYKTMDGQLMADVIQREPIARIFNPNGSSYYLDNDGYLMPLSDEYTARLIVVTGTENFMPTGMSIAEIESDPESKEKYLRDDLYHLVKAIKKDKLLTSLVDAISIDEEKEFILSPRIGAQEIRIGKAQDIEIKFKKLKAFYKEIIQVNRLDQYKEINLKYRDQVVCKKY